MSCPHFPFFFLCESSCMSLFNIIYVFFVPISCSKIILFLFHLVVDLSRAFPTNIFVQLSFVNLEGPVLFVLFEQQYKQNCSGTFWVFLLSPIFFLSIFFQSDCHSCPDDPFLSQTSREFYATYFLGHILICAYTIGQYRQVLVFCTILGGSPFLPNHNYPCIPFVPVCYIS